MSDTPAAGAPGPQALRVLCVSNMWPGPDDPDFGAFVRQMCSALEREGCLIDTAVIDRRGGGPLRTLAKYARLAARTAALARSCEVIYAHYLFPTGAIAVWAGRLARRPVVLTAHGQDVANLRRAVLRRATGPAVRGAAALIAVSGYLAARIGEAGLSPQRLAVIDMGVDMERFAPGDRTEARRRLGLDPDGPLILAVGGLTARKNPLTLLQAFARLHAQEPRARLAFVGDGPLAGSVDAGTRHLLLEGAVLRPGALEHERVHDWVAACDVLAMVSRVEPLGVAALEALAGGRPVVVTAEGGAREIVEGSAAGRVVDPADPILIAGALAELLAEPPAPEVCRAVAIPHELTAQAARVAAVLREALAPRGADRAAGENA